MKNIWIISILLIFSCSVSKKTNHRPSSEGVEVLVREFKMVFFKECIRKSSHNECLNCLLKDISTSSDFVLGLKNYKLIDSLVGAIDQKIFIDSLERTERICGGCDEETLQRKVNYGTLGRQTFGFCLDYYSSNELDSIARTNVRNLWIVKNRALNKVDK